ncbi:AAA family ATPase [Priestia endophytica]|nr:AAA family ATPase [Priestia endophytica]
MITLEKLFVKNYRKFYDGVITFDNRITAMAGANNSGKTSLVELMSNIFIKEKRDSINIEDLNIKARLEDELAIDKVIKDGELDDHSKIDKLQEIHKELNKITIGLAIKYDDDNDSLERFSEYLADVDITKRNFYFQIEYEYTPVKEKDIINILKKEVDFREIFSSLQPKVYYCDEHFEHRTRISDRSDFYNLFNYHCVYAIRKLSDTSEEKQNFLSKHLLKTVQNNQNWQGNLKDLIKSINKLLNQQDLSNEIDTITLRHIKTTLDSFSKTNGGNTGKLGIDFRLENKDIEKVLLDFIHIYFEQDEGVRIKEQKQGLGYSNLIYLLLEAQIFSEKIDATKVNLLVFEEPEAHLHPQMESTFIQYIDAINKSKKAPETEESTEITENLAAAREIEAGLKESATATEVAEVVETEIVKVVVEGIEQESIPFQMLITTHSSEMTKTIGLDNIRILRSNRHIGSKVYDLNEFINLPNTDKKFYEKFFQFNMVEMVFADKLILFEGDAERLLFKYIISNLEQYGNLSSQYISYIQVGGAYAHKYLDLIDFLEVKTLIFTDIDYKYDDTEDIKKTTDLILEEILNRKTTNDTIKKIVDKSTISEIFEREKEKKGVFLPNNRVCLKFQTDSDGYARTLEDALLHKLLKYETVFHKITKKDFKLLIENNQLVLTNTSKTETNLRDRVDKLNNKTDFMYALIYSGKINYAIPTYIEEGLNWLRD